MTERRYMEYDAMRWALQQNERLTARGLGSTHLAVLTIIAARSDEKHSCWMSYPTIAEEACASPSTAQRAVKSLITVGVLRMTGKHRTKNGNEVNQYTLVWNWGEDGVGVGQHTHPSQNDQGTLVNSTTE